MQIENYHVILLWNGNHYCNSQLEINDGIVSKNDKLPQLILRLIELWIEVFDVHDADILEINANSKGESTWWKNGFDEKSPQI